MLSEMVEWDIVTAEEYTWIPPTGEFAWPQRCEIVLWYIVSNP